MSSSTSSSRKMYLKILSAILLVATAAMGIINLIAYLNNATAENIMGRVVEARRALPKIINEEKDLVMVFGSSMVRAGFSPRHFDKEVNKTGKNIKSFNFGFGGLNPFFQDYLSRRIREAFQENDRRLKLAVIEFNPFQTTQTRWNRALPIVDSFLTMLARDQELWQITKKDPTRGIRLFNIKYIRNDISAEMITSYYGGAMFPEDRSYMQDEPEEIIKARREYGDKLSELFDKEYPDFKGENWHYGWQGGGTIPEERSAETLDIFPKYYATFRNDVAMSNYRKRRIQSADIEGLNFEPVLVDSFIRIVENFKQISDQVEIVMLPRNTKWINYSNEAEARLTQTIAEIERSTGLKIISHQEINEVTPDMFSDATHLARYSGDVAYTNYLVKQYGGGL